MPTYQVLGLPRNPVGAALKDVLTLGIWGKVWLYRINRELDGHGRFRTDFRWLAVLVALPLLTPLFVKWGTLHRLRTVLDHQVTVAMPNPKLLWLIGLVPILGTVTWVAWTQSLLNRHWLWHKREERLAAKADRIAELRPRAADAKVRARVARLEEEIRELETQRGRELEAAASRVRVREERAAAKRHRPPRRLLPARLGRRGAPAAEEEPDDASADAPGTPARRGFPFRRRRRGGDPETETEPAPEPPAEAPSVRQAKREARRQRKEEARLAKAEARAARKGQAPAAVEEVEAPGPAAPPAPAASSVKVLTLRCPQCSTRIPDVRKVAGRAVDVACPSCGFTATV